MISEDELEKIESYLLGSTRKLKILPLHAYCKTLIVSLRFTRIALKKAISCLTRPYYTGPAGGYCPQKFVSDIRKKTWCDLKDPGGFRECTGDPEECWLHYFMEDV